jgi:ParB family chromosome partitioning protein
MSLKDLKNKSASALADMTERPVQARRPVTSPGQLMAFQSEIMAAEDKIKALEAKVKDLEETAIEVGSITPNPWQPRKIFNEAQIQKLAGSIAEIGLVQPVLVRRVGSSDTLSQGVKVSAVPTLLVGSSESVGSADTSIYQLVAGERRVRAHRLLGKEKIKAIIVDVSDEEMAAIALAENIDREDLTAYEIATAIRAAESAFPNRKSLASCLGINRTDLYAYLAFFTLPSFVIEDLESEPGLLGRGAAEDIASVLKTHGDDAREALKHLWPRVKSGDLEQGRVAGLITTSVSKKAPSSTSVRDVKPLLLSGKRAGTITRDDKTLTVKIQVSALPPERESELLDFLERLAK